jgi:hypothetical protein
MASSPGDLGHQGAVEMQVEEKAVPRPLADAVGAGGQEPASAGPKGYRAAAVRAVARLVPIEAAEDEADGELGELEAPAPGPCGDKR